MTEQEIVEALTERRLDLGLTQRQVATRLHISPTAIHYMETGKRRANVDTVTRYADVVGLQLELAKAGDA